MRLWFSAKDLRHQARRSLDQLHSTRTADQHLDYALALSDALPEHYEERRMLQEALDFPWRVEDSGRKAIPKNARYWFNLGYQLNDQNRPKEAEAAYRKAIELDPEDPYPLANLGRLLATQGDTQGPDNL